VRQKTCAAANVRLILIAFRATPWAGASRLSQGFPNEVGTCPWRRPERWHAAELLNLNHLKIFFPGATIRASPGCRNIRPARAGLNPRFEVA